MCHCEERSDVAISGRHSQIVQAAVKTYRPIASVAALTEHLVQGYSTAQGHWCTARHPDVSLRGAKRRGNLGKALPIYTACRRTQSPPNLTAAALVAQGRRARENVAALTAQPLAALPPYGCGVPLAGNERPAGWQYLRHKFIGAMPSSLSLRGGRRPTWQSRSTRPDYRKAIGENATAFPRLHPKGTSSRFALRAPRRPLASSQ